ncbi:thioredoxin family protein [Serratia plymuthica]|uniref:thioredoxin family protein n=1 Tax=Serratia plymuthica TaxID=82996 RepID=UPI0009379E6D|nr:thioredoxin domain-containing protein [Serratia plymuthica]OJT42768.1 hypothetical protein BSR04_08370 [Serratia plymuthica]
MSMDYIRNKEDFDNVVFDSEAPVLVFFTGPWCGPCRRVAPVIEQIAEDYAGKLNVVAVNVDEAPEISVPYHVTSLPTFKIYKKGKVVLEFVGLQSKIDSGASEIKSNICEKLDSALGL